MSFVDKEIGLRSLYITTDSINVNTALRLNVLAKNAADKREAYLECMRALMGYQS